jgi:hypothetical protein
LFGAKKDRIRGLHKKREGAQKVDEKRRRKYREDEVGCEKVVAKCVVSLIMIILGRQAPPRPPPGSHLGSSRLSAVPLPTSRGLLFSNPKPSHMCLYCRKTH